ncbi:hypothetical protein GCM10009609_34210 [Pseudonocardia aurantiaca]|uniref:Nitric oxide reductase activation protein NorD n=1 Tax=Pseudonocardia aurantiaca TaxID=75290 RepID=A0ABW4FM75_9PSEU
MTDPATGRSIAALVPTWEWVFAALSEAGTSRITFVRTADEVAVGDADDRVRLPREMPYAVKGVEPADWYRIALMHRAAHYDYGTFRFRLRDLPSDVHVAGAEDPDGRDQHAGESDLEFVLAHVSDWLLAARIFADLEDIRVEAELIRRYGGFGEHVDAIRRAELELRGELGTPVPQVLALELLCRRSLGQDLRSVDVPAELAGVARVIEGAAQELERPDAAVTDSVLWALAIYRRLVRLPRLGGSYSAAAPLGEVPRAEVMRVPLHWEARVHLEGQDELESPWVPLPRYRDGLGFRNSAQTTTGRMESASIFRFMPGGQGGDPDEPGAEIASWGESRGEDERPSRPEPGEHEHYELVDHHYHPPKGRLATVGGRSFLYPEWDTYRQDYRAGWCRVRELVAQPSPEDTTETYQRVVREHRGELTRLRRRAERLVHEGRKTVRRTKTGDDIDIDAALEALTDLAAGATPSPNIHISREPMERDVAMVALFDLSASTAERVPVTSGAGQAPAPLSLAGSKRILDIELESMALLLATLAATGDQLGVYGFSSAGRSDVQFVILKDLAEKFSTRVARRLDAAKPIHSTRIGPAVRHAARKLAKNEASTKILLLVCDGRPYDLDYAPEGDEFPDVTYAVADTRRALEEAADLGIRVKVLGIDHTEQHYVREMCGSRIASELLPSVEQLPQRMVSLYKDLSR